MSSLIQISDSNAIVYISSTPFFGQLTTIRDISGKLSSSNTITVSTVGFTFADGTIRKSIDTPYALLTFDSFAKVVRQFPFTYGQSVDAQGLTTQSLVTVTGPTYVYDSLYSYNSISTLGDIDANAIYVGDRTNSIATPPMLFSTVTHIGQIYTSSIFIPINNLQTDGYIVRSELVSTVVNLGAYYISVPTLQSTINGLGNYKYISVASLASTVQSLSTSYLVRSNITSTIAGLGSFGYVSKADFLSTSADFRGGYIRDSSYNSTIASLATLNYVCTSQLGSTLNGLGSSSYISTGSLISTTIGLADAPFHGFSPLYISTTEGLGQTYISTATLVSTVVGVSEFNASNLESTVNGLGRSKYVSTSQLTSTIEGLGQIYISSSVLISTVEGLFNSNYTGSIVFTVNNLGTRGYVSTLSLMSTTSSIIGYESLQMMSTVTGAGTPYLSTTKLISTVLGLSNIYVLIPEFLSTIGGQTFNNNSNLVSTVCGLASLNDGYISTTQFFSTMSNISIKNSNLFLQTMTNLGNIYFSTPSLFSTIEGLSNIYTSPSNLISSVGGIYLFYTTGIVSTVNGLASSSTYVSSTQLFSTVSNVTTINNSFFSDTVNSLYSSPYFYISTSTLFSTVQQLSTIYIIGSNLTSTIANVGFFNADSLVSTTVGMGNSSYISTPQLVSSVARLTNANNAFFALTIPTLEFPPFNYIKIVSLSSTINGLHSAVSSNGINYIISSNLVSIVNQVNSDFVRSRLSTTRGLRFIGEPINEGEPPFSGSDASLLWSSEFISSIVNINRINTELFFNRITNLGTIYVSTPSLTSSVTGLINFSFLTVNNQLAQLNSTMTGIQTSNSIVVGNYLNYTLNNSILNSVFISTVSTVLGSNTEYHINLVNNLGSPPYSYISTTSLFSTVEGLSNLYTKVPALGSTVSNLSQYNISTLVSTVCGLGNSAYVSSTQLLSTVSSVAGLNLRATSSTIVGLASVSYISTASMVSTIEGLGNTYISTPGLVSNVSTYLSSQLYTNSQLTSSIANLGTKQYYSIASLVSTVSGLGSFYISTPNLVSTVVGLSNFYINTTSIPAINQAIKAVLLVSTLVSTTAGLGSLGFISSVDNPDNYTVISKQRSILETATAKYTTGLGSIPTTTYSNFTIPKTGAPTVYMFQSNSIVFSSNITILGDGIRTADIYCTDLVRATGDFRANAFFCDGTKLNTSSDRRLKFDIVPLSNALTSITQIKGTSYRLIDTPDKTFLGFLAQDMELIYPELVFQYTEHKSIKYDSIGVILLEAIKELNCECDQMLASLSLPYNKGI